MSCRVNSVVFNQSKIINCLIGLSVVRSDVTDFVEMLPSTESILATS